MSDNNNNNNNNISRKTVKKKQREGGVEPNPKRAQGVLKSPIPEEPDNRGAEGASSSSSRPIPPPATGGQERITTSQQDNPLTALAALKDCPPMMLAMIQSMMDSTRRETELRMELEEERRKSASRELANTPEQGVSYVEDLCSLELRKEGENVSVWGRANRRQYIRGIQ